MGQYSTVREEYHQGTPPASTSTRMSADPGSGTPENFGIELDLSNIRTKYDNLSRRCDNVERENCQLQKIVEQVNGEKEEMQKLLAEGLAKEQHLTVELQRSNREKEEILESGEMERKRLLKFFQNNQTRSGFSGVNLTSLVDPLGKLMQLVEQHWDDAKLNYELKTHLETHYNSEVPEQFVPADHYPGDHEPPVVTQSRPGTSKQALLEDQQRKEKTSSRPRFTTTELKEQVEVKRQVKFMVACNQYRAYWCQKCERSKKAYKLLSKWETHMLEKHGRAWSSQEVREELQLFQQLPPSESPQTEQDHHSGTQDASQVKDPLNSRLDTVNGSDSLETTPPKKQRVDESILCSVSPEDKVMAKAERLTQIIKYYKGKPGSFNQKKLKVYSSQLQALQEKGTQASEKSPGCQEERRDGVS